MSKGILFVAFNNEKIDYVKLAACAALRCHKYLELPVALVTNRSTPYDHIFQKVILKDYAYKRNPRKYGDFSGEEMDFKNLNRNSVYYHSPFDETILLDADYVVNSKHLLKAFDLTEPYLISRHVKSIAGDSIEDTYFHIAGIPIYWATAIYFDKSNEARRLFDCVTHVRENWAFYSARYKYPSNMYRNDYAFSIAHHLLSGRTTNDREFPVSFRLAGIDDELLELGEDYLTFHRKYQNCIVRSSGFDVHILHKASLIKCLTDPGSEQ